MNLRLWSLSECCVVSVGNVLPPLPSSSHLLHGKSHPPHEDLVAVTQTSLGTRAWVGANLCSLKCVVLPLTQAFRHPMSRRWAHSFLWLVQPVFSVVCSLQGLMATHHWRLWEKGDGDLFSLRNMPCTVLALGVFRAPRLHPGKEGTVPQLPVPCSLGCSHTRAPLPVCLHLMYRHLVTQEGLGCPRIWGLGHHHLPWAGFPSCLGRGNLSKYTCRHGARATASEVLQRGPVTQLL